MYHFRMLDYTVEISKKEDSNVQNFVFRFPGILNKEKKEEVFIPFSEQIKIWISIQITNWINTIGRKATFKQNAKRFEQYCKEAEKLKI